MEHKYIIKEILLSEEEIMNKLFPDEVEEYQLQNISIDLKGYIFALKKVLKNGTI